MASDIAIFATKSISLSICGGRKPQTLMDAARHNLREIQAESGADGSIDAHRIKDNVLLSGPGTAEGVQAQADEWLIGAGIDTSKMRRDYCQAIEVVFSLHEQSGMDPATYFSRCLNWVGAEMRLPILSAVIHLDEAAPHCHALLLPVRDGKHVGSYPIDNKALRGLRDSFFNSVAGPVGLKRMDAKMTGTVKRMAVAAVLRTCEAQGVPEKVGVLWPILRMAIERDPTKAVQALNLTDEEIRTEKKGAPNPIGFVGDDPSGHQNPVGFEKHPQKAKPYTCVGIAHPATSPAPAETAESLPVLKGDKHQKVTGDEGASAVYGGVSQPIETLNERWAAVVCRSTWEMVNAPAAPAPAPAAAAAAAAAAKVTGKVTGEPADGAAQASEGLEPGAELVRAVEREAVQLDPEPTQEADCRGWVQVVRDDGEGVVRVRDEYADDLSAWDD